MRPMTIGGKRVPCRMCGTRYAQYVYSILEHNIPICKHCLPWIWCINHPKYSEKDHTVWIPSYYGKEDIQIVSSREAPRQYIKDENGREYWIDLIDPFKILKMPNQSKEVKK